MTKCQYPRRLHINFNSISQAVSEKTIILIFIAPAYSRVRYRSPNFCPSVRSFVRSFVRQHLRRSLVFSTSEIAASLKPCIPYKNHLSLLLRFFFLPFLIFFQDMQSCCSLSQMDTPKSLYKTICRSCYVFFLFSF